jgi:hypothetical protein
MKRYSYKYTSPTLDISTSVITVSTFVTRYTFTLLLFEACVHVTSHERIYVTVITFSITHKHNFNICHTLHLHFQYYNMNLNLNVYAYVTDA